MYNREDASRIKHEFWTTFGRYMKPVPSSDGSKINWINYHTGIKQLYFRMDAGNNSATISISIEHHDLQIQTLHFKQLLEYKTFLHEILDEEWYWQLHDRTGEKTTSRIYRGISDVSVFNKEHWPDLISFFKPRIIALDKFWENAKYSFEPFRD
ncbi:MAG TPA: DUF4268 domain-containing protein [Chryseosolibacter sp.]|nr:DUF4268 domain-containing protein [Chryseosolibacter sp.]